MLQLHRQQPADCIDKDLAASSRQRGKACSSLLGRGKWNGGLSWSHAQHPNLFHGMYSKRGPITELVFFKGTLRLRVEQ